MTAPRLPDYLDHMRTAAQQASEFVAGMSKSEFERDSRTQQAVLMSFIVLGEAAGSVVRGHPDFAAANPQIPWQRLRAMRNRMAHGYFDIDLDVVWQTVNEYLPGLLLQLKGLRTAD